MAKKDVKLEGPLYTQPKKSLGGSEVQGPIKKSPADPLGYLKGK